MSLSSSAKEGGIAGPMFLKRQNLAAFDLRQGFIDKQLRPGQIVFLNGKFSNPLVDQLAKAVRSRRRSRGAWRRR
jgi:hypothetical protein